MENQIEIWKDVVGYEGVYEVSNFGRIKSLSRIKHTYNGGSYLSKEKILEQNINFQGYKRIGVWVNGKTKTLKVHQLVAIAFLNHTACGFKLVINHKDFDRTNNHVDNLEIVTNRENCSHRQKLGTSKYVGVYWFKANKKWLARIYIDGKHKYIGYFKNEEDAGKAYLLELEKQNASNKTNLKLEL